MPGVAQRVGRGIALLFHDRGTRRGWVISSMPQPHFTPGKKPVPILQEATWAPGPVWTGGKSRPHRDSILDRPASSHSLYRMSYPDNIYIYIYIHDINYRMLVNVLERTLQLPGMFNSEGTEIPCNHFIISYDYFYTISSFIGFQSENPLC